MSVDELERASRFAAGDLAESEHRQFEATLRTKPHLARALEQFRRLDEILTTLEAEAASESDERLIARAARQRRSRQWWLAAAAVMAVGLGAFLTLRYGPSDRAGSPRRVDFDAAPSRATSGPSRKPPPPHAFTSNNGTVESSSSSTTVAARSGLGAALQPSIPAFVRCYKRGLAQNPALEGSIIARLRLVAGPDGDGKVAEAIVEKDYTLPHPFVAGCVLEELGRARVPAPVGETEMDSVTIYFRRGDEGAEPTVEVLAKGSQPPAEPAAPQSAQTPLVGDAPSRGPSSAAVTVVEFTDPECPFCGRAHESLEVLRRELGERVRFAIKFAPLPFHRRAPLACAAALAAREQGKLWEYLDALFAHPDALDRAGLERTAVQLGLDAKKFKEALDSGRFARVLDVDASQAQALGISSVPTIYIDGTPLVGARPIGEIRAKITEALKNVQRNGRDGY